MKKYLNNHSGLTLIEVIIYITIVSSILTVAVFFAWDIIGGQTKSYVITEINQNSRFILEKIAKDFRQATTLNSVTESSVSIDLLNGDTVVFNFSMDPDILTYTFNEDDPLLLHSDVVAVTGSWQDLSTAQSAIVGLNLNIVYIGNSSQSDWQSDMSTMTSYELNLQP